MSRTYRFEGDQDVKWGIALPPEQRKIRGMQGPEPVSAETFGNFLAYGEDGLVKERNYDPHEPVVLRHLGVAIAHVELAHTTASRGDEDGGIIDAIEPQAEREAA